MKRSSIFKFLGICILFLLGISSLYSQHNAQQQIDSIKTLSFVREDTMQVVDDYNEIAILYGTVNIDSSLYYSDRAKKIATNINYINGLATAYSYHARANIEKGQLKVALENFTDALKLFVEEKDSINMLDCYRGMSYVVSYSSDRVQGLDYNRKALGLAQALNDSLSMSIIYNNIGTLYLQLHKYELAIYYMEKSLSVEVANTVKGIIVSHSNIGIAKVKSKQYEQAAPNYTEVKRLLPDLDSEYLRAYMYLSLANYYNSTSRFDSTDYYVDKAEAICHHDDFPHILARVYRIKGEKYFNQKAWEKCIESFDEGIKMSKEVGSTEEFPSIYKMKSEAYSNLGNYKMAFAASKEAMDIKYSEKESTVALGLGEFEQEQRNKNEMQRYRLETELKNQHAENDAIKMKFKLWFAIVVVILLLLTVAIVIYFLVKVRKNNDTLKEQHGIIHEQKGMLEENIQKLENREQTLRKLNITKDKLFNIIAHDLRSPFNSILGLCDELNLNYESHNDKQKKEIVRALGNASESAYSLLNNLLNWARSQRGTIKINIEKLSIRDLIEEGIAAYQGVASVKSIQIDNAVEDLSVLADKETVNVVVSNLFNNALKFSHEGGVVTIESSLLNKDMVSISFKDTGIGMSKELSKSIFNIENDIRKSGTSGEKGTGLGLLLCKEFIEKNGGEIYVRSEFGKGSEFIFTLPLA